MTDQPSESGHSDEPLGSAAEEAAKLFAAFTDWAKSQPASGFAEQGAAAVGALGEHIANGEDCRFCPVCQVIHAVRTTSPEVRSRLALAAGSFAQALSAFLTTEPGPPTDSGPVQNIDLDED